MSVLWKLGPLDDIIPDIGNFYVLCFPCPRHRQNRAKQILHLSFQCLVSDNPVLGGLIKPCHDGVSRPGTMVLVASKSKVHLDIQGGWKHGKSYKDLIDMQVPRGLIESPEVMSSRDTTEPDATLTTAMKAIFIDGGCLLTVNISHKLTDGTSVANILAAWAAYAAHIAEIAEKEGWNAEDGVTSSPVQEDIQRALSRGPQRILRPNKLEMDTLNPTVPIGKYETLKKNARSWQMLGLDHRPSEASSTLLAARMKPEPSMTRIFIIQHDGLQRLKKECSIQTPGNSKSVSTTVAVAALMWRSIVRARTMSKRDEETEDKPSNLMMPMDIRNLVSPKLSSSFLGNAVLYSHARSTVGKLVSSQTSLAEIAMAVRASYKQHQQPHVVQETLELAASIPDVRSLGLFHPTFLANDIFLTSMYNLPINDIDWGKTFGEQGTPDYIRFPRGSFEGPCFLLPRRKDGSAEIQISMKEAHMQNLLMDSEFRQYAAQWAPAWGPSL